MRFLPYPQRVAETSLKIRPEELKHSENNRQKSKQGQRTTARCNRAAMASLVSISSSTSSVRTRERISLARRSRFSSAVSSIKNGSGSGVRSRFLLLPLSSSEPLHQEIRQQLGQTERFYLKISSSLRISSSFVFFCGFLFPFGGIYAHAFQNKRKRICQSLFSAEMLEFGPSDVMPQQSAPNNARSIRKSERG